MVVVVVGWEVLSPEEGKTTRQTVTIYIHYSAPEIRTLALSM